MQNNIIPIDAQNGSQIYFGINLVRIEVKVRSSSIKQIKPQQPSYLANYEFWLKSRKLYAVSNEQWAYYSKTTIFSTIYIWKSDNRKLHSPNLFLIKMKDEQDPWR